MFKKERRGWRKASIGAGFAVLTALALSMGSRAGAEPLEPTDGPPPRPGGKGPLGAIVGDARTFVIASIQNATTIFTPKNAQAYVGATRKNMEVFMAGPPVAGIRPLAGNQSAATLDYVGQAKAQAQKSLGDEVGDARKFIRAVRKDLS
jgi:hypothetical protein